MYRLTNKRLLDKMNQQIHQMSLSEKPSTATISIQESANRAGVSTATIRNWIKTGYLTQSGRGQITLESFTRFQEEIAGKEKLNHRANKSQKDNHNHEKVSSKFLEEIKANGKNLKKLGGEYESSLSDSYRNKEGIYYTPEDVVKDLFTVPSMEIGDATFCDPCCGSGNFVIRALELGFRPENVFAYDFDPVAVELTKQRIYLHSGYKSENIKQGDFLEMTISSKLPKFDYIFTNPPWGKKLEKQKKENFSYRLQSGNSKDTCSLFFFASLKCLKNKGKLGLLLPESFFNISIFEGARNHALDFSIERLIDYGKPFKGLVTKAQAIVLQKTTSSPSQKVACIYSGVSFPRSIGSFSRNPKSILNFYCQKEESETISYLMNIPNITLANRANWGLGIVTGNNKKFIKKNPENGHIPVFKGADITKKGVKEPSCFIPSDISLYQQVAPIDLYKAEEKLIYKFIASNLCFFYDDEQRFILNSANMLIPNAGFPISIKVLGELLSSEFMNWLFSKIFNTHKILRGDLEFLPIHAQFLENKTSFNENQYLNQLKIERTTNGTYRIKK